MFEMTISHDCGMFWELLHFYFEIPKISTSITPYHMYPKICASPFGLHGELTRAVLSAKTYRFFFSSPEQKVPVSYSTTHGVGTGIGVCIGIGVGVHKC